MQDFPRAPGIDQDMLYAINQRIVSPASHAEYAFDEKESISLPLVAMPRNRNIGFEIDEVRIPIGVCEDIPVKRAALVSMVAH
jgi:hypothetical protein